MVLGKPKIISKSWERGHKTNCYLVNVFQHAIVLSYSFISHGIIHLLKSTLLSGDKEPETTTWK